MGTEWSTAMGRELRVHRANAILRHQRDISNSAGWIKYMAACGTWDFP